MDYEADRKKLTRAMAQAVHAGREVEKHRRRLQQHASGMLDARIHAAKVAREAMAGEDNPLVARYHDVQLTEAAELRGVALREEARRGADRDRGE